MKSSYIIPVFFSLVFLSCPSYAQRESASRSYVSKRTDVDSDSGDDAREVRAALKKAAAQAMDEATRAYEEARRISESVRKNSGVAKQSNDRKRRGINSKSSNKDVSAVSVSNGSDLSKNDPFRNLYLNTLHLTKQVPYWGVWRRTSVPLDYNRMELDFYLASLSKTDIKSVTLIVDRKPVAKYSPSSFSIPAYKSDKDVRYFVAYFDIPSDAGNLNNAIARFSTSGGKMFDVLVNSSFTPSGEGDYNSPEDIFYYYLNGVFNQNWPENANPCVPSDKTGNNPEKENPQMTNPIDPFDF